MTTTVESSENDFGSFQKVQLKEMSAIEWIYLQYLLVSGIYMLEPWERRLFNSIIVVFLSICGLLLKYFLF